MKLAKEISALLDNQREILTCRLELCGVRKKQYALWATKLKRAGHEDRAELIERTFIEYFENERISVEFLLTSLKEAQELITKTISQWEAEANA